MAEVADHLFSDVKGAPSGQPLYLRLRRAIEEAVDSGVLGPGDALPSERDIALQADTVCLHGDGVHAVAFARKINEALVWAGVERRAPGA